MRECEWCGKSIVSRNAQAHFCSSKCRVYAHRAAKTLPAFPTEMVKRDRWIRRAADKRPLQIDGSNASSTNPATWTSYDQATKSTAGVGLGYVLGDGIGCIDLDHCITGGKLTEAATAFVNNYPSNYIEISPSGEGLHIWGTAEAKGGRRQSIGGLSIETYSIGRYITITGNIYQQGKLLPL